MQRTNVQLHLHPGDTQKKFYIYTGRLRSLAQPLLHTIFEGKDTPFVSWYPFHIPSLEHCFPFNCCKCTLFKIYETITKQNVFSTFFTVTKSIFYSRLGLFTVTVTTDYLAFQYLKPEKVIPFGRGLPL